jgi:hypothetical protein
LWPSCRLRRAAGITQIGPPLFPAEQAANESPPGRIKMAEGLGSPSVALPAQSS